jgi:transglutaminase-like putative cysteine protease
MIGSVAYSVAYADWMPGMSVALWAVFFGALAGLLLAHSSFPSWTAHLSSLIYGLFCVAWIGVTRPGLVEINDVRERVLLLVDRIIVWLRAALSNGTSNDAVIFVLIMSGLFWLLAYSAAWYSFRKRRIWHVILPAGVTLFSNVYFYAKEPPIWQFLLIYLACVVVLLALSNLADREENWLRNRVRFAGASLRGGFIATGLAIALIAMLASWRVTATMTSPTVRQWFGQFNEPYNEVLARWNRLFSTLQNPIARPVDTYPDDFELGGPRNLTTEPVMDVVAPPARYFWRARSHNFYDGRTWKNTLQQQFDLAPDSRALVLPEYTGRREVLAAFTLQRATQSIWLPSQPVRVNIATRGVIENADGGTVALDQLKVEVPLLAGNRYAARGSVSTATVRELREATTTYGPWLQPYLQMPAAVPERVRDLAASLTRSADNPFDKSRAVERWLRSNITYDDQIEAPPIGREATDYVLFDTRRAYCDYYATAMIVMLRSQGIPARYAQGYAQGTLELEEPEAEVGTYKVIRKDSHSWVEVFFPGYGWVEFEPTSGQPEIPRLDENPAPNATPTPQVATPVPTPTPTLAPGQPTPTPPGAEPPPQEQTPQAPDLSELLSNAWDAIRNSALRWLLLIPVLIVLAVLGLRVAERYGLAALPVVEQIYGMLTRWAGWLGIGRGRHNTPYEQAAELALHAPETRTSVDRITSLYVARRYAPQTARRAPNDADAQAARDAWAALRKRLGRVWLVLTVRRLVDRTLRRVPLLNPAAVPLDADARPASVRDLFKVPAEPEAPPPKPEPEPNPGVRQLWRKRD